MRSSTRVADAKRPETRARRIATLVAYTHMLAASARDDVIDIFDVVFGDLQRAATHRGQKRRAGELRDYDQAVAAVHAHMACDEDRCRILSQSIRSGRRPVAGGRLVVR